MKEKTEKPAAKTVAKKENDSLMEKIVSLCKRRGFVFPGSEIYGGLANSWDYGPLGVELKNNIKNLWWDRFVHRRDDVVGLDAALIMNPKVWEASGHLLEFTDPLVECRNCHSRFRADQIGFIDEKGTSISKKDVTCPECGKEDWVPAKQFNLMFKTFIGAIDPIEDLITAMRKNKFTEAVIDLKLATVYFRPETAQAMFVDFKNILDTSRKLLPFGIAQVGKAFRNEITPGNFIFRTREFEQMEIEYFIPKPVHDDDWMSHFEHWRNEMRSWMENDLGLNMEHVHELEVPDGERAHYSKRTIDFEFDFPFGKKELYGLAYRTDFDLRNHFKEAPYKDPQTGEAFWPHTIEPTWGVDRSVLAVLANSYIEESDGKGGDEKNAARVFLKLPPRLAPYKAAIFPLLANKPELVARAREVYDNLRKKFFVAWDDRGNIGKRYYAQDEIGTPFCITIDFDSLENGTVTVRNRDTATQERVAIDGLAGYLAAKLI
jgi:glycyl-tRNA synthetase